MSLPAPLSNLRHQPPAAKVQLVGRVAGIEACWLLTDNETIVVGSAADCDLVLLDPLAPRRTLKLVHAKNHAGPHHDCDSCWTIEALPGSRVYVNGGLVRRERLMFGDSIATGCHELQFDRAETGRRERRANMAVDDVCQRLIGPIDVPRGFLSTLASWRDWQRTRKAWASGAVAAVLLLAILLLFRTETDDDNFGPPLQVVVSEDLGTPSSSRVRSLGKVARKAFKSPPAPPQLEEPQLNRAALDTIPEINTRPIESQQPLVVKPAAMLDASKALADAGPNFAALELAVESKQPLALDRQSARLAQTAARRRTMLADAVHSAPVANLGAFDVRADRGRVTARTFRKYSQQVVEGHAPPSAAALEKHRAANLAALQYAASPVELEMYRGQQIPIGRVPQQLAALSGADGQDFVQLDGNVSESEAGGSFKTGRFRVHGPGQPTEADPPTYCYVSKNRAEGKDHLYISFVCQDPNLGALVQNESGASPGLAWDDSVEIFLDLNQDRNDYHHIIVSARGLYFASYCPDGDAGINGRGTPWDSGLKVKTTIDQAGGRWVCEILVPYDHLPQQPSHGAEIPFNVCRNFRGQRGGQPLQNWFAVYDGTMTNYHHPRLFGKLVWP